MRILRLKIKNIASLKGEHEIDFQEIQKEGHLFAITGETGAGKSTILNTIGLALYGQVYKKNINQMDVVTLGEKDGAVELIIQVKGKYYLADWKAKVKKSNGEAYATPQPPVRNLYQLSTPDFNGEKTISNSKAEELLNLDFDQFCKCIILNQGEFAKFLTSSFSDRKDILEKLYPGEVIESMGRELKQEVDNLEKEKREIEIKTSELKGDELSGEILKSEKERLSKSLNVEEETFKNIESLERHFLSCFSYFEKYAENENKKINIKLEISKETTKFNLILKKSEEVFTLFQEAKKEHEFKAPKLQELLQKEEELKHQEESLKKISDRISGIQNFVTASSEKINLLLTEKNKSEEEAKSFIERLHSPVDILQSLKTDSEALFETYASYELLSQEYKGKKERFEQLEESGKALRVVVDKIKEEIELIPLDLREKEENNHKLRKTLLTQREEIERARIQHNEISNQILLLEKAKQDNLSSLKDIQQNIQIILKNISPIDATLKIQAVINASEICVDHAISTNSGECPVCLSHVSSNRWEDLKTILKQTDLKALREEHRKLSDELEKNQFNEKYLIPQMEKDEENLSSKKLSQKDLEKTISKELPSTESIDAELDHLKKLSWKLDSLKKDLEQKNDELNKLKDQYRKTKDELAQLNTVFSTKKIELETIYQKFKSIMPSLNADGIRDLKIEIKNYQTFSEAELNTSKISHEMELHETQRLKMQIELDSLFMEHKELSEKIKVIKLLLQKELNGEKASTLISQLQHALTKASDEWSRQLEDQKKQELVIKDANGRLFQLEELSKDFDLQFSREKHQFNQSIDKDCGTGLTKIGILDLSLTSPIELFIPVKDLIKAEKEQYRSKANETRMSFASISTRLSEWEKIQDKIQLFELKYQDLSNSLARKMRLYDVLGKDELRTFVLALVEEGLIQQTNEELQKLCQGRYEIIHQTKSMKMTPEFYILDKFREGGKRKISTLSGGETFMVSLAMALGLAEMTRGQAEIDSLFIDEGFGTLDQESLEDVLDMLQQIQTRGLTVGIISHIKTLTNALPVNLVLNKRPDGTSSITYRNN
jgi:exonuclease SbcC